MEENPDYPIHLMTFEDMKEVCNGVWLFNSAEILSNRAILLSGGIRHSSVHILFVIAYPSILRWRFSRNL